MAAFFDPEQFSQSTHLLFVVANESPVE